MPDLVSGGGQRLQESPVMLDRLSSTSSSVSSSVRKGKFPDIVTLAEELVSPPPSFEEATEIVVVESKPQEHQITHPATTRLIFSLMI